jgi:hypothetical protein
VSILSSQVTFRFSDTFRFYLEKRLGKKAEDSRFWSPQPARARSSKPQISALEDFDSDEEEKSVVSQKSKRGSSRMGSVKPTRTTARKSAESTPLFIEDDEDESQVKIEDSSNSDSDGPTQTLKSTAPSTKRSTRQTGGRKAAITSDDDSDDGFTFKGFRGKARR